MIFQNKHDTLKAEYHKLTRSEVVFSTYHSCISYILLLYFSHITVVPSTYICITDVFVTANSAAVFPIYYYRCFSYTLPQDCFQIVSQ